MKIKIKRIKKNQEKKESKIQETINLDILKLEIKQNQ